MRICATRRIKVQQLMTKRLTGRTLVRAILIGAIAGAVFAAAFGHALWDVVGFSVFGAVFGAIAGVYITIVNWWFDKHPDAEVDEGSSDWTGRDYWTRRNARDSLPLTDVERLAAGWGSRDAP